MDVMGPDLPCMTRPANHVMGRSLEKMCSTASPLFIILEEVQCSLPDYATPIRLTKDKLDLRFGGVIILFQ